MNRDEFFSRYPQRKADSNKYDNGVVMFLSGSYGMAGASILNIIGARSAGASYIHSFVPHSIYPIVAGSQICTVYHPYDDGDPCFVEELRIPKKVKAVAFGSGCDALGQSKAYLQKLIATSDVPLVVDAFGLRILSENEDLYPFDKTLILTPHTGEFSALCHLDPDRIEKDRKTIARDFALNRKVILVLKGPETLVVSPEGKIYENHSGNKALASAGSGDVLTGMIAGLCSLYEDPFEAVCDAVWLHGHLCDQSMKKHSVQLFDLLTYPFLADAFFKGSDDEFDNR